jgi:hypothetical protein
VPVLLYRQRRGHHGQRISDSDLDAVFIWKDGTVAWRVIPYQWYQATIPVEKLEVAIQGIAESFANYPVKDRSRRTFIILGIGANYSPSITAHASQHYERSNMCDRLWRLYLENREEFQSGDDETILETIKRETRYRTLVEHYRRELPNAGLSEQRTSVFSDEEVLKVARLFAADAEHLLLMEKKILELLSIAKGLEVKRLGITILDIRGQHVHVEREINDGKSEFFYTIISERERDAIRDRLRAGRER